MHGDRELAWGGDGLDCFVVVSCGECDGFGLQHTEKITHTNEGALL